MLSDTDILLHFTSTFHYLIAFLYKNILKKLAATSEMWGESKQAEQTCTHMDSAQFYSENTNYLTTIYSKKNIYLKV